MRIYIGRSLCLGIVLMLGNSICAADIALVTHPSNALKSLSVENAKRFFLKRTRRFPDGSPAEVAMLSTNLVLRYQFNEIVLHMTESQLKTYWARYMFTGQNRPPIEFSTEEDLRSWVASTPGALGYLNVHQVDDTVKVLLTLPVITGMESEEAMH